MAQGTSLVCMRTGHAGAAPMTHQDVADIDVVAELLDQTPTDDRHYRRSLTENVVAVQRTRRPPGLGTPTRKRPRDPSSSAGIASHGLSDRSGMPVAASLDCSFVAA